MKKVLIALVILLVGLVCFTGCSSTSSTTSTAPANTTQTVVTTSAPTSAAITTTAAVKPVSTTPVTATTTASTTSTSAASSKYGGVLRVIESIAPGSPIGFPAESSGGGNQFSLQPLIKEQLGGTFAPCLATSYDISTDPQNPTITFNLRKGVKFHDGSDFNAEALKWNLEQVISTGLNKGSTTAWKKVEVVDEYTFKITFNSWSNRHIRTFSSGVVFCVSPTAFKKNGIEWMRWNMVGTGPFLQKEFKRDVSTTYTRYNNYWEEGKPYLDGLQQLFVADPLTRLALFKSGGAEILNMADNGRTANELKAAGFEIITYQAGATVLVPDSANADSPWSNLKVRQAAEYAIDKDSMVNALGYGYWKPANQLNSPANMAYNTAIEGRKFDVAKAKQLLSEAGYPNGFKTRIILQNTFNRDVAVAVQSFFSKVGIQAELEVAEAAKFAEYMQGNFKNALLLNTLQEWANANNQLTYYWGIPPTYFKNVSKPEGWGEMVNASLITKEPDVTALQKLEKIAVDDAMAIPLYYGATIFAITDKTKDTGLATRGNAAWWEPQNAWLSK